MADEQQDVKKAVKGLFVLLLWEGRMVPQVLKN